MFKAKAQGIMIVLSMAVAVVAIPAAYIYHWIF